MCGATDSIFLGLFWRAMSQTRYSHWSYIYICPFTLVHTFSTSAWNSSNSQSEPISSGSFGLDISIIPGRQVFGATSPVQNGFIAEIWLWSQQLQRIGSTPDDLFVGWDPFVVVDSVDVHFSCSLPYPPIFLVDQILHQLHPVDISDPMCPFWLGRSQADLSENSAPNFDT
jgi:hypothetical protein